MEWKCKHCQNIFYDLTVSMKCNHGKWCKSNPTRDKNIEKLALARNKIKNSWNKGLTKATDSRVKKTGETYSTNYKDGLFTLGTPHTEEMKNNLSVKRKKWLKENPDKHPWKRSEKFVSKPCEYFKSILKMKNLSFEEEFSPIEDRFFSVDIAFPDIKICIEINGEQHYNRDGSLSTYYQDRHDLIEANGWKVLEIHYAKVYDEKETDSIVQWIEYEFSKF